MFVEGDIADRALLDRLFRQTPFDAVMHFAADSQVGESVAAPLKYYRNNVAGSLTLIEAMVHYRVEALIFSSTAAVYGTPEAIPISENHPRRPGSPYGATKVAVERLLADCDAAHGLRSVCLRYFNAAGADESGAIGERHQPESHLIPLVLQTAGGLRKHIQVFGNDYPTPDGSCIRDYVHVTDLAQAHLLALEHLMAGGASGAFNVGNSKGYSVREVIETARRITGKPIPAVEGPRRAGDPAALVASSERIRDTLGWRPRYEDLETILATAWRWHRKEASGQVDS
jgi:UDP-glucose 4-epimerase